MEKEIERKKFLNTFTKEQLVEAIVGDGQFYFIKMKLVDEKYKALQKEENEAFAKYIVAERNIVNFRSAKAVKYGDGKNYDNNKLTAKELNEYTNLITERCIKALAYEKALKKYNNFEKGLKNEN